MAAETKIKTACPVCGTRYKVAESIVGQSARCRKCGTKFRVAAYDAPLRRHPNEDDILRWLNEGREEEDFEPPREYRDSSDVSRPSGQPTADRGAKTRGDRLDHRTNDSEADTLSFRKIG